MVEEGKSLQKGQEEQNALVVRDSYRSFSQLQGNAPLKSLLEAQVRPPLEIVGFSPLLPQRLKDLNDAVVEKSLPRLSRVSIDFTPGETPSLGVETAYKGGMHVSISSHSGGKEAALNLEALDERGRARCRIADIQSLVRSLFPEEKARVRALGTRDSQGRSIKGFENLDKDLYFINDDILASYMQLRKIKSNTDVTPYENYFEVMVADQSRPPLLVFHLSRQSSELRPTCLLSEVHYGRSAQEVEDAIGKVTDLFKKPFNPYENKRD